MSKKENVMYMNITKVNPTDPNDQKFEVSVEAEIKGAEPVKFELAADNNITYDPKIGYGVRFGRLHCVRRGNNKKYQFDDIVPVERNMSQKELIVHVDYKEYDNDDEIVKLSEMSFVSKDIFLSNGPGKGGGSGSYEP